jgi:hypothetical protein
MLYMDVERKTRVTFRVDPRLAAALRQLPNQTLFVENALLEAFGQTCPVCDGRGKVQSGRLAVSDFKRHKLPPLTREAAPRLREVVKLGQRLMATHLKLVAPSRKRGELVFELSRHDDLLMRGRINGSAAPELQH